MRDVENDSKENKIGQVTEVRVWAASSKHTLNSLSVRVMLVHLARCVERR